MPFWFAVSFMPIALLAAQIRSEFVEDTWTMCIGWNSGRAFLNTSLRWRRGVLLVAVAREAWRTAPRANPRRVQFEHRGAKSYALTDADCSLACPRFNHHLLSLGNAPGQLVLSTYEMIIPLWLLFLLFILPSLINVRRSWRRYHRNRFGLCVTCGYDLRGSTVRCSECGSMVSRTGERDSEPHCI